MNLISLIRLCERRDRIRFCSKDKIEQLKSRDPVFRKRYRQYEVSKYSDRVPVYDSSDAQSLVVNSIPNNFTIQRGKQDIIEQQQNIVANKSTQIFQNEMEFLREKTKSFIKSINKTDQTF